MWRLKRHIFSWQPLAPVDTVEGKPEVELEALRVNEHEILQNLLFIYLFFKLVAACNSLIYFLKG